MAKPKIAVIGTGGTICSIGAGPFDTLDYGATKTILHADQLLATLPELGELAELVAIRFHAVASPNISFPIWHELLLLIETTVAAHPDLAGIVILHGTATIEETAYFLSLTVRVSVPVVLVGSQRPPSALSSDAGMNLAAAIRTAACDDARGMGVLVVLNDEIHAARDVAKTSTFRLQTFRSGDFGLLGHADGDRVVFYRRPIRLVDPDAAFDVAGLVALPRVDIVYSYAGSDGTASRAFVAAGAVGIVSAGFAPGFAGEGEAAVLRAAVAERGLVVVQSTRVGSGRTFKGTNMRRDGFLSADNLTPQKARILLALALTRTRDVLEIEEVFRRY